MKMNYRLKVFYSIYFQKLGNESCVLNDESEENHDISSDDDSDSDYYGGENADAHEVIKFR